jgi:hypothetical protein
MSAAYQAVGLSTAEVHILAKAQKKRDYYYRSVKGRRLFELGLGPAALAFVGASSEQDQLFLDELVATRPAAEYAGAMLERRGVRWATSEVGPASPIDAGPQDDAETLPMSVSAIADLIASELASDEAITTPILCASRADTEDIHAPAGRETP